MDLPSYDTYGSDPQKSIRNPHRTAGTGVLQLLMQQHKNAEKNTIQEIFYIVANLMCTPHTLFSDLLLHDPLLRYGHLK